LFPVAKPVIIYNHKTGIIKEILHTKCNSDLAMIKNNGGEWIRKARKSLDYDDYFKLSKMMADYRGISIPEAKCRISISENIINYVYKYYS
jgi:hypothetical protein